MPRTLIFVPDCARVLHLLRIATGRRSVQKHRQLVVSCAARLVLRRLPPTVDPVRVGASLKCNACGVAVKP